MLMRVSSMRQLGNQEQDRGWCILLMWKERRLKVPEVHQLLNMYCVLHVTEPSVARVTRKDIGVWKREGNQSVNNVE